MVNMLIFDSNNGFNNLITSGIDLSIIFLPEF